ncbi:hypothetical protein BC830DRAFT_808838 [Chytriomyces sp. MP71]|nr:hypothetical protein BC830DRAFT_808838 [Chytriomyces sp. MP71]
MRGFVLPGGCVNLLLSISAASADPSKLVLSFGGASFPSEPYLAATQGFNQYFKAAATYYTSNSGTGQNGVFLGRFEVGASDVPINTGLYGTNGTIVAIPAIAGGLVVSYNVPGRNKTKLKFSRKVGLGIHLD